ncbi:nucleotidyltransferase-like protein [Alkalispirillum mobile]|uniref:Nucleotidyltransferase-like protein n=1 Tax=Alkalispirillum mobile TaxID=85925 RepID=A0A498BYH8_9GAMM|nr:nucleotidyltransferase domain-containing protein [Alkalispirillum mobile]RLK48382.1 nucleotidyltransferase-like protein [Alkalispirillum mobile]
MRLTDRQIKIIKEEVARILGSDAEVWLFGSRVDDNARGGDIDLMIEADVDPEEALQRELRLYSRLIRRLGDQRIDIVIHRSSAPRLPIHEVAMETGKRL